MGNLERLLWNPIFHFLAGLEGLKLGFMLWEMTGSWLTFWVKISDCSSRICCKLTKVGEFLGTSQQFDQSLVISLVVFSLKNGSAFTLAPQYSIIKLLLSIKQFLFQLWNLLIFWWILVLKLMDVVFVQSVWHQCCITMDLTLLNFVTKGWNLSFSESNFPLQFVEVVRCLAQDLLLLGVFLSELILKLAIHIV